jgi:hypothetical protein
MGSLATKVFFSAVTDGCIKNSQEGAIRIDTIGWVIFIRFAACIAASG